jgi:hypothetical protein
LQKHQLGKDFFSRRCFYDNKFCHEHGDFLANNGVLYDAAVLAGLE